MVHIEVYGSLICENTLANKKRETERERVRRSPLFVSFFLLLSFRPLVNYEYWPNRLTRVSSFTRFFTLFFTIDMLHQIDTVSMSVSIDTAYSFTLYLFMLTGFSFSHFHIFTFSIGLFSPIQFFAYTSS
jgi:hypothetical protein